MKYKFLNGGQFKCLLSNYHQFHQIIKWQQITPAGGSRTLSLNTEILKNQDYLITFLKGQNVRNGSVNLNVIIDFFNLRFNQSGKENNSTCSASICRVPLMIAPSIKATTIIYNF